MAKFDGPAGAQAASKRDISAQERVSSTSGRFVFIVRENSPPNLDKFHLPHAW